MSENKSLVSKSEISSYLHAATEMERDIYTLETMCDELEKKAKETEDHEIYGLKNAIKSAESDIDCHRSYMDHAEKQCASNLCYQRLETNFTAKDMTSKSIFGAVFISVCIPLGILAVILFFAGLVDNGAVSEAGIIIFLTGWIPSCIIAGIADQCHRTKAAEEENQKNAKQNAENQKHNEVVIQKYINGQKDIIANRQKTINEYTAQIQAIRDKAQSYRDRIKPIQQDLQPLYSNRDKFYSVGIVPPDYRTMDCVYVLDQIFRNDLADTMRDAVLLYEERTFRGDVIRGMKNITAHIDNLSSLMSSLRVDINMIGRDVALLRDDMDKIYTQNLNAADVAARHNDRMYEETQLHRYAVEALQKSNQKIVDYIES